MKTNVADTSIEAYDDIKTKGILSNQQLIILRSMDFVKDYSLQELVEITDLSINSVSGRVNELKFMGLLKVNRKRHCHITHRTINAVCLTYPITK